MFLLLRNGRPFSKCYFKLWGLAQDKLSKLLADFFTDNCKGSDQDIVERGKQLFYSMCLQEEECVAMEKATRTQRDSYIWYQQQYGRLTASSFHSVLIMKKQTGSKVADRLLKNKDLSHISAVKRGIDKKDTARQAYTVEILSSHQDFCCTYQSWSGYQFAVSTSRGFTRWLCKLQLLWG